MLDISRCKVPRLDTLFELVDWLAGLKINQVRLYAEHTFAYREHPEVWADASPITGQDVLELDAYCRERFIELVPNRNSFGHLAPWLAHPRYRDLAEAPDGFDWPWGGRSYVCPGTSSWNSVAGRTDNATGNLRNAAEQGMRYGAVGYLNTDWGDHGHWQYQPTAYLGYMYGAAVSWASQSNADLDLAPSLGLHGFADPTGNMGRLAYDLGNVYQVYERLAGRRVPNASSLVAVLYEPVEEPNSRFADWAQVDPEVFRVARQEIDAAISLLPQARMMARDAAIIRREYENAARLLRHACSLGELKVALARTDGRPSAGVRQWAYSLAEDMRAILAEHRELWLARNRVGGLEEGSGSHFQGMIDAYRRIAGRL